MSADQTSRLRRIIDRFFAAPASLLSASAAIIGATAAIVLLGALVIYVFDRSEFDSYGEALWFTLQTATTVGYGDLAPQEAIGRIVAAAVMLVSVALLTAVTATITSYFIQRSSRVRTEMNHDEVTEALAHIRASLQAMHEELETLRNQAVEAGPETPNVDTSTTAPDHNG